MKVVFIGTGEAFDENTPNNSCLIESETRLLIDCGYTIPQLIWKYNSDPNFLDAIYISHTHADHYFGLPLVLARMSEGGRKNKLTIICSKGNELPRSKLARYPSESSSAMQNKEKIINLIGYGFANLYKKVEHLLEFIEVDDGGKISLNELKLSFALTDHSAKNLAIKVSVDGKSVCYSGDGKSTDASRKLYFNSTLLIHDGYSTEKTRNHESVEDVVKFAIEDNIEILALNHISRRIGRKKIKEEAEKLAKGSNLKIITPQAGDLLEI
ncbi:MAG: ribonuclease Z [Patescibacteria group bacterium]|nr:ribonuclease Z [Patescibacteria group bacterium]